MEEFWILILAAFFAINLLDKAESVKLELKTFDEIFGEGWWDKDEAEDLKMPAPTNFGQNVHHQIDRQNTQFGQIEHNSNDQNPPLTESDHAGQIEPNSTDQNPPLTESIERKRKIVDKFHAVKDEFKQKGKYSTKEWNQIDDKIAKHLQVSRKKIYKWKKEFGISGRMFNEKEERKHLIRKFDQMKAELTRDGFKNAYHHEIDKTVAKELGLSFMTIFNWKRKLSQSTDPQHNHNKQKELMKHFYEIKGKNPKISDENIAKILKIGRSTLFRWKKQFKRQQSHQNSVDGQSVAATTNSDSKNAAVI